MSADMWIQVAGVAVEAVVCVLLTWRRAYTSFPFFYAYLIWGFASDCVMLFLGFHASPRYLQIYSVEMSLDSVLQYAVLVELASLVIRPFRASLPRGIVPVISILVLILAAAAWPFTNFQAVAGLSPVSHFIVRLEQTFAILRILFFLVMAVGSHQLAIGWRDRELQLATGLGFYSLVSLSGVVLQIHLPMGSHYHLVDQAVGVSYGCSLLYWVVCFARKEAPQREFTAQHRALLASVAARASAQRVALQRNQ